MKDLVLSRTARKHLESFLPHARSGRECCRAQALLWLDNGEPLENVADHLQVSRQTVYNWVRRFHERDHVPIQERLRDAPRSGRPPTALGLVDALLVEVIDKDPREYGYSSTIWTCRLLQYYLQVKHQVNVSRKSVSRAIGRLGLRWKRPRYVLANRSPTWRQAKGG